MELLATTRGQDDDLHTYVVAESARRGDASALRTLLEQDSAHANRVDATGSSALMHASEAGQAECCSVLLAGGADPHLQRTSDGATALGLAAANGKPGSIHALLQHDPGLVNSTDGSGRTALHHAVAAGSFNTAKYLLGRWGADDALPDAQGDTPLHLCATRALLLLLAHGPPNRPLARLGKLTNRSGQTPVDAWEAAGCAEIVQAARTRGSWLYDPHPQELAPTVSFLRHSPSRVPPRARPPPAWPRRLLCVHLGIVWLPFCVLAFGCFTPLLGPRVWLGFWAWILLGAGGCCLAVCAHLVRLEPPTRADARRVSAAHAECGLASAQAAPGLGHFLQPPVEPSHRRAPARHADRAGPRHAPHPTRARPFARPLAPSLACPLALTLARTPLLQVIVTHHAFILVPLLGSRPLLGLATLSAEAMVYRSYWQLLRADAGFVPGGTAEAARLYWASLERPPAGGAAAAAGAEPGEGGFDHRSETVVPPRARYSPMAGGPAGLTPRPHAPSWDSICELASRARLSWPPRRGLATCHRQAVSSWGWTTTARGWAGRWGGATTGPL